MHKLIVNAQACSQSCERVTQKRSTVERLLSGSLSLGELVWMHSWSVAISLAEFLDSFFNGWYLEITMERVIRDVPLVIIPRIFDRYLCGISTLESAPVFHTRIPQV